LSERYKVLGAIVALREFTVEDIANRTGVKQNTVSTILARERPLLEKIADEKTGRRGGKRKRYRIKPDSAKTLYSELTELYRNLPAPEVTETERDVQSESKSPSSVPLGLLAAEDTLLARYTEAEDHEEKQRLLRLAKLDFRKGLSESRRLLAANPGEETRIAIEGSVGRITALQKIFELDLLARSSLADSQAEVSVETLRERLSELSNSVSEAIKDLNPALASVRRFPVSKPRQSESLLSPQHESYTAAQSLLDRASLETDAKEKSALLEQASKALEVVWQDYEGRDAPLITIGFIRYEQGRLGFLRQDYKNARMFFRSAREIFSTSEKHSDEITKVDQHLAVLSVQEFRANQPGAPAQMEIGTTLAALEGIDSRSQANYPLIRFFKDLLTKTVSRFAMTETLLKQQIRALNQQIHELKLKLERATAPDPTQTPWGRSPAPQYGATREITYQPIGYGNVAAAAAAASPAHAHVRGALTHESRGLMFEALELSHSVDLSGQKALSCSRFDEIRPNRGNYDLFMTITDI
jgi:hypothetical protein